MKKIYVAGGCFWGIEEYFKRKQGILDTTVGYLNSNVENPSYELVCTGITNSAEALEIIYDEKIISLEEILEYLFKVIDPTSLNKQGNDIGTQYRTGIYTNNLEEKEIIFKFLLEKSKFYDKKIVFENENLINFYPAEEYHQDYLSKNPNGYCHIKLD